MPKPSAQHSFISPGRQIRCDATVSRSLEGSGSLGREPYGQGGESRAAGPDRDEAERPQGHCCASTTTQGPSRSSGRQRRPTKRLTHACLDGDSSQAASPIGSAASV